MYKEAPGFCPCPRVVRDQRAIARGPGRVIHRVFSSLHLTLSASSTRTSERPRSMPDPRDYIFSCGKSWPRRRRRRRRQPRRRGRRRRQRGWRARSTWRRRRSLACRRRLSLGHPGRRRRADPLRWVGAWVSIGRAVRGGGARLERADVVAGVGHGVLHRLQRGGHAAHAAGTRRHFAVRDALLKSYVRRRPVTLEKFYFYPISAFSIARSVGLARGKNTHVIVTKQTPEAHTRPLLS